MEKSLVELFKNKGVWFQKENEPHWQRWLGRIVDVSDEHLVLLYKGGMQTHFLREIVFMQEISNWVDAPPSSGDYS